MKRIFPIAVVALLTGFTIGCQSQAGEEEYVPTPAVNAAPVTTTDSGTTALPALPPVLPQVPLTNTAGRPAVNPAHGLPFHDCALEVGAPFPTSGQQPAFGAPAQSLPPSGMQPVLPSAPAGVRLNPEHGKPGHRCEIAVGAPLS
ncbi:MAG: hypothetical protein EOP51_13010 [Sphingobacteriales bacterium]|nr:MAG: hypothetical protein EOP51_13010 [Sphingobacteriales bacterium]